MKEVLTAVSGIVLVVQAFIGLFFFVSCLWEGEKRASFFAGLQLAGMLLMLLLFIYLGSIGFFQTIPGAALLALALVTAAVVFFLVVRRSAPNEKALQGTKGLIIGEVKRWDEREIMFARNRSIRPGSTEHDIFYKEHPEFQEDVFRFVVDEYRHNVPFHNHFVQFVRVSFQILKSFAGAAVPGMRRK